MKKFLKTASMILMALAIVAPMGALAEAPEVEIILVEETAEISLPATEILVSEPAIVIEESTEEPTTLCRVTFYDFTGCELESQDVVMGGYAVAPQTAPEMMGMTFSHWYNDQSETREAFDFNTPVYGGINLYPQGVQSVNEEVGVSILETVVVESQPADLGVSIIENIEHPQAIETVSEQPMTIEQLFGGEMPSANQQPQVQMDEMTIIQDILSAGNTAEQAQANDRTEVEQNAVMDILNAQVPQNDEIFEIEDDMVPLAAPAIAPSVEVVCDYEGTLAVGTEVTVRAIVHNLPDSYRASFQWQNDASGSFADVAGATGETYTFTVGDFGSEGCNWRVNVDLFN